MAFWDELDFDKTRKIQKITVIDAWFLKNDWWLGPFVSWLVGFSCGLFLAAWSMFR